MSLMRVALGLEARRLALEVAMARLRDVLVRSAGGEGQGDDAAALRAAAWAASVAMADYLEAENVGK